MSNPALTVGLRVIQISTGKIGVIRHREELFNECITCFDDLTAGSIPMSDLRPDINSTTTTTAPTQTPTAGYAGATTTTTASSDTAGEDPAEPWTAIENEDLAELDTLLAANQDSAPAEKGFGEGDLVSVYSASQQKWYQDGVVEGTNTDKDGLWYVVRYSKGERQKLIHEFDTGVIKLRTEDADDQEAEAGASSFQAAPEISKPQETMRVANATTSIPTSDDFNPDDYEPVSPTIFKVGDPVAIYSTSKDSWFPDGTIKRTEEDNDGTWLVVQYNGGASEKAVNVLDTEIIRGLNYKKDDALDEF